MIYCPHCHAELPDDSIYCDHCGKEIKVTKVETPTVELKENPRKNVFSQLGLIIFLFALIVLDFVIGTILANIGFNSDIVFVISAVFYILAIICAVSTFVKDYLDVKHGYKRTGNRPLGLITGALSVYLILVNVTQVLLK